MKLKWCVVVSWEFSGAEGRVFFVCVCVRVGIAGRERGGGSMQRCARHAYVYAFYCREGVVVCCVK